MEDKKTDIPNVSTQDAPGVSPSSSDLSGALPASTPESNPPATFKPSRKKLLLVVLVVIIVAVVLGGGYFLWQRSQNKTPQPTSSPSTSSEPNQRFKFSEPFAVPNDWQTYTSDKNMNVDSSFIKLYPNLNLPTLSFQYPKGWKVVNVDPNNARSIYKDSSISLPIQITKEDPEKPLSECHSDGPCENYAQIELRIGVVTNTVDVFGTNFWGVGFPIAESITENINNTIASIAYVGNNSPYPTGIIFHITPPDSPDKTRKQLFAHIEFFNFHDDKNETQYSKKTIEEINQILSTFQFTGPSEAQ